MIHIAFGQDMTDLRFEIDFMPDSKARTFEKRQVNITEALNNVFEQLHVMISKRYENPISLTAAIFFNKNLDFGPLCS